MCVQITSFFVLPIFFSLNFPSDFSKEQTKCLFELLCCLLFQLLHAHVEIERVMQNGGL
jgi:hypothetical protein